MYMGSNTVPATPGNMRNIDVPAQVEPTLDDALTRCEESTKGVVETIHALEQRLEPVLRHCERASVEKDGPKVRGGGSALRARVTSLHDFNLVVVETLTDLLQRLDLP